MIPEAWIDILYNAAETVLVLTDPEFREQQPTWIAWTQGPPRNTVAIPKYCHGLMVDIATRAMRPGKYHYMIRIRLRRRLTIFYEMDTNDRFPTPSLSSVTPIKVMMDSVVAETARTFAMTVEKPCRRYWICR